MTPGHFGWTLSSAALVLAVAAAGPLVAQEAAPKAAPPAIEDNSFFIEEAYNQEAGVVQHISTFFHSHTAARSSDFSFTQEWPIGSQAHQLSFTLPYSWASAESGVGDVYLNYRYQLFGHDRWAAVAPRLSLVVPTGSKGTRTPGVQVNLPASKRVNPWLVVHANAGATLLPGAGERSCNLGASAIGLLSRNLNVMLEVASTFGSERGEAGLRIRRSEAIVSPGVRYAINRGSLQIVPGLALPVRVNGERAGAGVFAYLSLEHPF